ncbi:MAG TPA: SDR family oxidoreductase [Pirellulales bacterium]|jgi:NAD(P)-dependent dehydrogenase (short-subunit alcohol dehydrogenase family)|nr:SDR family oxidoreductase [Pirellulales bacterium]
MDLELKGNVGVVVGAARGLGQTIAAALINEGAQVALLDVSPAVEKTAAELGRVGTAQGWVCDVTDYAAVEQTSAAIRARFGRVDHVFFAVAIGSGKFGFPFWSFAPDVWDRVLRVNLIGAAHVAHAFAPTMAEAGRGTFLFVSSVAGQIGSQTDPPYSASKAGLINFAQCAAKDLAPYGVRVNTLCPGMVQTALNRAVWQSWADRQPPDQRRTYEDWAGDKVRQLIPLRRWQTSEDMAAMALFLASGRAQNVTGQTINVDGGWVMHW